GVRANEDKQRVGRLAAALSRVAILEDDRFQMVVAFDSDDLGPRFDTDVALGRKLFDQIMRHARCERVPAHQDGYAARVIGEEHRSLAGRVSTADQKYVASAGAERFGAG